MYDRRDTSRVTSLQGQSRARTAWAIPDRNSLGLGRHRGCSWFTNGPSLQPTNRGTQPNYLYYLRRTSAMLLGWYFTLVESVVPSRSLAVSSSFRCWPSREPPPRPCHRRCTLPIWCGILGTGRRRPWYMLCIDITLPVLLAKVRQGRGSARTLIKMPSAEEIAHHLHSWNL